MPAEPDTQSAEPGMRSWDSGRHFRAHSPSLEHKTNTAEGDDVIRDGTCRSTSVPASIDAYLQWKKKYGSEDTSGNSSGAACGESVDSKRDRPPPRVKKTAWLKCAAKSTTDGASPPPPGRATGNNGRFSPAPQKKNGKAAVRDSLERMSGSRRGDPEEATLTKGQAHRKDRSGSGNKDTSPPLPVLGRPRSRSFDYDVIPKPMKVPDIGAGANRGSLDSVCESIGNSSAGAHSPRPTPVPILKKCNIDKSPLDASADCKARTRKISKGSSVHVRFSENLTLIPIIRHRRASLVAENAIFRSSSQLSNYSDDDEGEVGGDSLVPGGLEDDEVELPWIRPGAFPLHRRHSLPPITVQLPREPALGDVYAEQEQEQEPAQLVTHANGPKAVYDRATVDSCSVRGDRTRRPDDRTDGKDSGVVCEVVHSYTPRPKPRQRRRNCLAPVPTVDLFTEASSDHVSFAVDDDRT